MSIGKCVIVGGKRVVQVTGNDLSLEALLYNSQNHIGHANRARARLESGDLVEFTQAVDGDILFCQNSDT